MNAHAFLRQTVATIHAHPPPQRRELERAVWELQALHQQPRDGLSAAAAVASSAAYAVARRRLRRVSELVAPPHGCVLGGAHRSSSACVHFFFLSCLIIIKTQKKIAQPQIKSNQINLLKKNAAMNLCVRPCVPTQTSSSSYGFSLGVVLLGVVLHDAAAAADGRR